MDVNLNYFCSPENHLETASNTMTTDTNVSLCQLSSIPQVSMHETYSKAVHKAFLFAMAIRLLANSKESQVKEYYVVYKI
jgi:hypothetical protein